MMSSRWYELEGGESDVLFDELRKQVLQLTEDDNDDEKFAMRLQGKRYPNKERRSSSSVVQVGCEFDWTGNMDRNRVPEWLLDLWRTENKDAIMLNGTGVFIPHIIVNTTRRYKPRKKSNGRGRELYKPVAKVN